MLKSYGWGGVGGWVAYVIIVSAQVPLVLTLGLWTSGLGLTICKFLGDFGQKSLLTLRHVCGHVTRVT